MYRSTYRCTDCKHTFQKTTEKLPKRAPSCPMCKEAKRVNFKTAVSSNTHNLDSDAVVMEMIEARKAPSVGGSSNFNKAIDATAEIVMKDYGMTDINIGTNLRNGDNCVPKLAPELEQKVDKVFSAQPNKVMGMPGASQLNKALMGQINAGMYKNQGDPVSRATETVTRKPTTIIHEYNEKPKTH